MQQMEEWVVVPRTDAALPLWTATDGLWRRYLNEFSSPVVSLRQLPRSACIVINVFISTYLHFCGEYTGNS